MHGLQALEAARPRALVDFDVAAFDNIIDTCWPMFDATWQARLANCVRKLLGACTGSNVLYGWVLLCETSSKLVLAYLILT